MPSAIITGANSGLGLETARELGARGWQVVLACRDTGRGEAAAASVDGDAEVRELDLADLASVRSFAQRWDRPVDVLVNNAGIMMVAQGRTADGFERQLGTNHLGPFALTNLLLPQVTGRVVTVSSVAHWRGSIAFDDLDLERRYSPTRGYAQSKLANLLFTLELQRRLTEAGSPVLAVAAHPGYAATNLTSHHASRLARVALRVTDLALATSARSGARPTVHAATAEIAPGEYVGPGLTGLRGAPRPQARSRAASDEQVARRLWQVSEERTGVTFPL